jgi:hypothetical protein
MGGLELLANVLFGLQQFLALAFERKRATEALLTGSTLLRV